MRNYYSYCHPSDPVDWRGFNGLVGLKDWSNETYESKQVKTALIVVCYCVCPAWSQHVGSISIIQEQLITSRCVKGQMRSPMITSTLKHPIPFFLNWIFKQIAMPRDRLNENSLFYIQTIFLNHSLLSCSNNGFHLIFDKSSH